MTGRADDPDFSPTRRRLLAVSAGAAGALFLPISVSGAFAANPTGRRLHGISAFGDLKYPAGFEKFDYADPDAPTGGTFAFQPSTTNFNQSTQTFNTLNSFVLGGDAPPRMELTFDTLLVDSYDEPDSLYCHLAAWIMVSEDRNTYTFGLRPEARFRDGTPVTSADVVFSLLQLKQNGHPQLAFPLAELISAKSRGPHTAEIRYSGNQSAHAVLSLSTMPIFSRAYYTQHPFDSSSLAPPLSSGPWKVGRVDAGRTIEYERAEDYWGRDLPTIRGLDHFDRLRIDFFAEREPAFQAFKKGDILWREEFTAKVWATGYAFPAVGAGKVVKGEFAEEKRPIMQAWALNQRHERFADVRVRQAIDLCFDFAWTNAKIFYNGYTRSQSIFERSPFKAEGKPSPAETALMKGLGSDVPETAFGEAPMQPVANGSGKDRVLLKKANDLLSEAGWKREGTGFEKDGTPLDLEILMNTTSLERACAGFVQNMRDLGIGARMRVVDAAQYQRRLRTFDFDMTMLAVSFSSTPTAESLGQFFSSTSAKQEGSYNLPGVDLGLYDALLQRIAEAKTRDDLVTAMRVLDRVLRARLDWIPCWYAANHRVAYWDVFGFSRPKPDYAWPVERLWWYDTKKAEAIGKV
ncbi:extracellular solute-binding protein [Pararhizobium mangrovi]|uniref:ABC transporter substrate-binding protein n=1 Tax=Pararhizobium mangrovi TaxID=2590452 RepID=A0A506TZN3_9HYPH|nr:extracellular solute-binding protein [Pararhizobium mangrovi]TPW25779.1 ABC transporter substrate-binding protein [Pararhizobium mangrovi]